MSDLGRRVYGLAAIVLGLIGLRWDEFAAVWQPVEKTTPGYGALAYLAAALFVFAGLAVQSRRAARIAASILAMLYLIFVFGWVRRIASNPQIFGTWSGAAEQLSLVMGGAAVILLASSAERRRHLAPFVRIAFGVCAVAFGLAHFLNLRETAAMTPAWAPPGPLAWAAITGACHVAAGVGLISGVLSALAARLLTAMFGVFGVLVWAPRLIAHAGDHTVWCGNAINLALVGAIWAVADLLARRSA